VRRAIICGIVGVALIAVSVAATRHSLTDLCSVSGHWIKARDGTRIYARLHVPLRLPFDPAPGILVTHGYMANLGMVEEPLVRPLVAAGFVVLSLDRHGNGWSGGRLWAAPPSRVRLQDFDPGLAEGIQFLRAQPHVDPLRIGLVGHSDGSRAVIMAACADWSIAATVGVSATGHPADWMNEIVPKDLLLLYGSEDRFVTPADREVLMTRATDGHPPRPGELVGDVSEGDARLLMTIPGAGHVTALFSPLTVREAIDWLTRSLSVPVARESVAALRPPYFWLAVGLGGALLVMAALVLVLSDQVDDLEAVEAAPPVAVGQTLLWLILRVTLFGAGVFSATFIARLIDPLFTWVPLDGAHWFVALPWGVFIGACVTASPGLATSAHRRDAYQRFRSLAWSGCPRGASLGVLVGFVEVLAVSAALIGWYEAFPSPTKVLALVICFPIFFVPCAGIEIWLRAVLPAGLTLSRRAEQAASAVVLLAALCLFLSAGLQPWPAITYIPYYLTAGELCLAIPLLAHRSLHKHTFVGAAALAFVGSWVATTVCPLY